ncbi:MAG: hypothetical protein Unbinned3806contig1000_51 [Prokaryotic dsDNA virus sp.]|nr:MAG: hypothetical protein Unbinned3806contig1000_51 [Prokaryotic dsDNA virus sp.]
MEELSYSLPPKQALVAAYEQHKGNNNTWTYKDPSKYPIRKGKYGYTLGNCWVKHGLNNTKIRR